MEKRCYTDAEKAEALAVLDSNEGNVTQTAHALGMPRKTLEEWAKGRRVNGDVAEIRLLKKGELAERFEAVAEAAIAIPLETIARASLRDRVVAAGICVDKARLLREEPTEIRQSQDIPIEEKREFVRQWLLDQGLLQVEDDDGGLEN